MKKLTVLVLGLFLFSSTAFADGGDTGRGVGSSLSGFFKKLDPRPFFKSQEDAYKERKAAGK